MACKYQVSIIILTYNPNLKKLIRTVNSVVSQKNINFEIIISDDGSKNDCFSDVKSVFDEKGFVDYYFNKNAKNVGTVKNIISGVSQANGKYVYLISPGDMLYDDNVIKEFFDFSEMKNSKITFGQYLCYMEDSDNVIIKAGNDSPKNTLVYSKGFNNYKNSFLLNDYLVGPTYFREKETFIELVQEISKYSIYVEDTTTTILALAKNIPIHYYPEKIVWYEKGFGISQGIGNGWGKKVEDDIINTFKEISKMYPKDRVVKAGYHYRNSQNKKDFIKNLFKYPCISIRKYINSTVNKGNDVLFTEQDREILMEKLK